jgi:hypothetical protein
VPDSEAVARCLRCSLMSFKLGSRATVQGSWLPRIRVLYCCDTPTS